MQHTQVFNKLYKQKELLDQIQEYDNIKNQAKSMQ
jgi:hypothetical protein